METKINNFLEDINKRVFLIKECHTTWWYLISQNEDRNNILEVNNKYLEFFEVIKISLFTTIVIKSSTLFDKDDDSISFNNLIKMVYPKKNSFTSKTINYNELHKKGRALWGFRSKAIAHCDEKTFETDFLKETKLTFNDLALMIDDCRKLIKEIYDFCEKPFPIHINTKSNVFQLIEDLSNMNKLLV